MNKAIINAICKTDKRAPNLKDKNENRYFETYLKNSFVSLKTAKIHNQNVDVILVVNFELDDKWRKLFCNNNIIIKRINFMNFLVKNADEWSGAYFKLEALEYILSKFNYDKIMVVDTDTIFMKDVNDIWSEVDKLLLLYDTFYLYSDNDMIISRENYNLISSNYNDNYIHYGGEFICGNKKNLNVFIKECKKVVNDINALESNIRDLGDEQIISIAADKYKNTIKLANGYIGRCWNGVKFREVPANYKRLSILHVPSEKEYGMIILYKRLTNSKSLSRNYIYFITNMRSSMLDVFLKRAYSYIKTRIM